LLDSRSCHRSSSQMPRVWGGGFTDETPAEGRRRTLDSAREMKGHTAAERSMLGGIFTIGLSRFQKPIDEKCKQPIHARIRCGRTAPLRESRRSAGARERASRPERTLRVARLPLRISIEQSRRWVWILT